MDSEEEASRRTNEVSGSEDTADDMASNATSDIGQSSETIMSGKKRKQDLTEQERLEGRRAANRRSALESRKRRKKLIQDLQATVDGLSNENRFLRQDNTSLRFRLSFAVAQNHELRSMQVGIQGIPLNPQGIYANPSGMGMLLGSAVSGSSIGAGQPLSVQGATPNGSLALSRALLNINGQAETVDSLNAQTAIARSLRE